MGAITDWSWQTKESVKKGQIFYKTDLMTCGRISNYLAYCNWSLRRQREKYTIENIFKI